MQWNEIVPAVIVGLLLAVVPGYFFNWAIGARWTQRLSFAPLVSISLMSSSAVILGKIGIAWSISSYIVTALVIALIALFLRFLSKNLLRIEDNLKPIEPVGKRQFWVSLIAVVISSWILIKQLKRIIGSPDSFSQSYDNIFHLNAIRWIFDTNNGSSLSLGSMTSADGSPSFYPAAWHDFAALIFRFFGGTPVTATNIITLVVAGILWPLSVWALTSIFKRDSLFFSPAAILFSSVLLAYPGLMLKWGILYPNMLGYAILPAFWAAVIGVMRAVERNLFSQLFTPVCTLFAGGIGVALAHPNAITSAAVLVIPLAISSLISSWNLPDKRILRRTTLLLALVVCFAIWLKVRPGAENSTWEPTLTNGHALGEFLGNSYNANGMQVVVSLAVLVGIIFLFKSRENRWLVLSWGLVGYLYVIVSSSDREDSFRMLLTGPWYNDKFRLAALSAIPVALLAAFGVEGFIKYLKLCIDRFDLSKKIKVSGVIFTLILMGLGSFFLSNTDSLQKANISAKREFTVLPDSLLITEDELDVLNNLHRFVSTDQVVLVDPWEGSSLAYALEDVQVTSRHSLSEYAQKYDALYGHLNDARDYPEVCKESLEANVVWYLDFEDTLSIGSHWEGEYRGLENVTDTSYVEPVYISGNVGLYKLDACQ